MTPTIGDKITVFGLNGIFLVTRVIMQPLGYKIIFKDKNDYEHFCYDDDVKS
jgi:hypothetical protein